MAEHTQMIALECLLKKKLRPEDSEQFSLALDALLVAYITQFIFVLVSNAMVILGLTKTHNPLPVSQKLFICLSIVDVLTSFLYLMRRLMFFVPDSCQVIEILLYTGAELTFFSFVIFITICTLRYWSIKYPLKTVSNKKVCVIVGLETSYSFLSVMLTIYLVITNNTTWKTRKIGIEQIVARLLVVLIVAVNVLSCCALKKEKKSKNPCPPTTSSTTTTEFTTAATVQSEDSCDRKSPSQQAAKSSRKAGKTLFIISTVYVFCNLPLFITAPFINKIKDSGSDVMRYVLLESFKILWLMATGITSIIYIIRAKNLRLYFTQACFLSGSPPRSHNTLPKKKRRLDVTVS